MNNSHLLGLILFGVFALLAALTWFVADRANLEGSGWTRRGVRIAAVMFLVVGLGAGWGAFSIDSQMRATTLFEQIAEGDPGGSGSAPTREMQFVVEHPNVEHALSVAPLSRGPVRFNADVAVRLLDEQGQPVLDERLRFVPEWTGGRNPTLEWATKSLRFMPRSSARFTLLVTPLTAGIARVHIHIADPQKRDGQRIPGY